MMIIETVAGLLIQSDKHPCSSLSASVSVHLLRGLDNSEFFWKTVSTLKGSWSLELEMELELELELELEFKS